MENLRTWLENENNSFLNLIVKACDGKDTVFKGMVGSLKGDMLNIYGNVEIKDVKREMDSVTLILDCEVIDPTRTKMRFTVVKSAEEQMQGEVMVTYAEAKAAAYVADAGNWISCDGGGYCGSFYIDLESARL